MKDAAEQSTSSMSKQYRIQKQPTLTMMQIISRAVTDCLDDEIVLLNEDFETDAIFSGIKNLISEEIVEFREDMGEDYRLMGEEKLNDGDGKIMMSTTNKNGHHEQDDMAILQSMVKQKGGQENGDGDGDGDDDDERSDFLVTKNNGIFQEIPNLISFKQKKMRRRNPHGEDCQSYNISPAIESSGSNFDYYNYSKSIYDHRQVEEVDGNKKPLKISRWRKKGLLTFRKQKNVS